MNLTPISVAVLVGIALSGCATASRQDWTKAGASREDLARDRYACIQESRVPYSMSHGSTPAPRPLNQSFRPPAAGFTLGRCDDEV